VLSLPDGIMPFVRLGLTEDEPAIQVRTDPFEE
jgi:hypothetical protein